MRHGGAPPTTLDADVAEIRHFLLGLDEDQVAVLTAFEVHEAHDRITSLAELVAGWAGHVDRLISETTRSVSDRDIWTEHDYVAALHLRDRLAAGLKSAPESVTSLAKDAVAAADLRFESWTIGDSKRLLARVVPSTELGPDWWWHRVPRQGPVVDSLLRVGNTGG